MGQAAARIVFPFSPQETQARAAKALHPHAKTKIIGYGGPKFGGKSWTIQYLSSLHFLSRPINVLIIGHKYEDMKQLHIEPLKRLLKDYIDNDLVKWREIDKSFVCSRYGSIIKFQQVRRDSDAMSLNGQRWDLVLIDEAQKFTPFTLSYLRGICGFSPTASDWKKRLTIEFNKAQNEGDISRQKEITDLWNRTCYYPKMLYCFNWGEKGHSILRRWFWDGCKHEGDPFHRRDKYLKDEKDGSWLENPDDFMYIFADMTKNKAGMEADPGYVKQLKGMEEPYRTAYITGNPDAFQGLKYEIHPQIHEIDFDEYLKLRGYHDSSGGYIPDEWYLYASIDSGVNCSASLFVKTHEGKSFQISDYYQKGDMRMHIREIIADWERNPWSRGRMPDIVFGDRFMFAKRDKRSLSGNELTWESILREDYGLFCYQVVEDRVTSAQAVGAALHYETDEEGKVTTEPLIYFAKKDTGQKDNDGYTVYQRFCEPTINEVVALESDPKRPEDIKHDEGIEDHAFDKLKIYLTGMASPQAIRESESPENRKTDGYGDSEEDMYKEVEEAQYEDISDYAADGAIDKYGR